MNELIDAINRASHERRRLVHLQEFNADARDALRDVVASYDKAIAERPDLPLPTYFMCALEAARRVL